MPSLSLSKTEEVILRLLAEHGDLYGLELVERSSGVLKRGTVYVTLGRMVDKGHLRVLAPPRDEVTSGLPRPRYRATALGHRLLDAVDVMLRRKVVAT